MKKKEVKEEEEENIYDQQEEPDNEVENENENENDEEKDEQKILEEQLEKQKSIEDEDPSYNVENAPELVIFLYNKISHIFDNNKQKYLLLLLLFFGLKQKEEIPSNYKKIIQNINRIYFNKNLDQDEFKVKSPISHIDDFTWKCLKQINDCSSYIFSIIIDHIDNHPQEWESFLDDEDILIERKFNVLDEDLSSTINPFTKFIFFSIIKTHLSDSIISTVINDIINNEENPFIIRDDPNQNTQIILEKTPNLEELFFRNINITRKPIIIIDKQNGEIIYQKEIKELFLKKLKPVNIREDKEKAIVNDTVTFKEISPSKIKFTNWLY